jgi:hypothetical protein
LLAVGSKVLTAFAFEWIYGRRSRISPWPCERNKLRIMIGVKNIAAAVIFERKTIIITHSHLLTQRRLCYDDESTKTEKRARERLLFVDLQ